MWQQEFTWFFALFHQEFRKGNRIAFEVLMALAFAHFFGFYNPKQLADFLDLPHQKLYAQLKDWSLYYLRACRVMEVGGLGQRFQPKEHQVLILG